MGGRGISLVRAGALSRRPAAADVDRGDRTGLERPAATECRGNAEAPRHPERGKELRYIGGGGPESAWRGARRPTRLYGRPAQDECRRAPVRSARHLVPARLASTLASAARARASADVWPRGSFSGHARIGLCVLARRQCFRVLRGLTRGLRDGCIGVLLQRRALLVDRSGRSRRGRFWRARPSLARWRSTDLNSGPRRGRWRGRG